MNTDFKHRHHHISFNSAINGLKLAITTEINMKIILIAAVFTVFCGLLLNISYNEWLAVILSIALVFVTEMINTSVEAVTDLVTEQWHKDAKIAKDVAGGMVLSASFFALAIGLIIFLPKLSSFWGA
ncbi:MAG: diacylglycerol kinase family protein [Patescibacteria group bacterium]|nr:diacylglycerol kinase family protein [Patescibacteria group bacterium]